MLQKNAVAILHFLAKMIILDFLIARYLCLHLILELLEDLLFRHNLSIYLCHALEVIGAMDYIPLLFQLLHFIYLFTMELVIRTVVKNFDGKDALLELALRVDGIFFRLNRYDLKVFVENSIAVDDAFIGVQWLLD